MIKRWNGEKERKTDRKIIERKKKKRKNERNKLKIIQKEKKSKETKKKIANLCRR